jgi:hypothetical protein
LSRFRTLTIFAALIAAVAVLSACGGGSSDDPQTIVNEATLQGIESGKLDLSLGVDVKGKGGGHLDFSLSGPFQSEGEEELPELDLSAKATGSVGGEGIDFEGGLTLLANKAFVEYSGTEYEVDPTTFNFVKSAFQKQLGKQKAEGEASGCQDLFAQQKFSDFIKGLSEGGSVDVGGTETTKFSGEFKTPAAFKAIIEVLEDPVCREQLRAIGSIPSIARLEQARHMVEAWLKEAHVVLYIGDDHIIRRTTVRATVVPPAGSGKTGEAERVTFDFDLTLTGVNEDQTILAPRHPKPLSDLFLKLGINPIELAGALSEEGGLEGLLEGLGGGSSGGGGGGQRAYLSCIKKAHTAVDIQRCVGLLQ